LPAIPGEALRRHFNYQLLRALCWSSSIAQYQMLQSSGFAVLCRLLTRNPTSAQHLDSGTVAALEEMAK